MTNSSAHNKMLNTIEALLYSEGGETAKTKMLKLLEINDSELNVLIREYNSKERGLKIVEDDKRLLLRVSPIEAPIIERVRGESAREEISKTGLEVLSIVLYRGSASASDIEYIRGVNSGYTLRQLTSRGLLLKSKKGMTYQYSPSAELLALLGISHISELPKRDEILETLIRFEEQKEDDR